MKIIYKETIESTNDFLKNIVAGLKEDTLVIAKAQTKGKGRHGRRWISPLNQGFYVSFYIHRPLDEKHALLLGVLTAKKTLNQYDLNPSLKLPNDLYLDNKKVGGILIERNVETAKTIIGIGINIFEAPLPTATAISHHKEDAPDIRTFTQTFVTQLHELKSLKKSQLFNYFKTWFEETPMWAIIESKPLKIDDINEKFECLIQGEWKPLSYLNSISLST